MSLSQRLDFSVSQCLGHIFKATFTLTAVYELSTCGAPQDCTVNGNCDVT